jgi:hypothetical protein
LDCEVKFREFDLLEVTFLELRAKKKNAVVIGSWPERERGDWELFESGW